MYNLQIIGQYFLLQMATCYHCREQFTSGNEVYLHAKGEHPEKDFIVCKIHLDEQNGTVIYQVIDFLYDRHDAALLATKP